jgi:putative FmdB family regulatory protein
MPLYDYECDRCGTEHERLVPMADRHSQTCTCGGHLTIAFKPTPRYVPFPHYFDIGLGEHITSWAQRRRIMKEQHCDHRDPPRPGDITARRDWAHEARKQGGTSTVFRYHARKQQASFDSRAQTVYDGED